MEYNSPLRYPGGKGKVADYFKLIFEDNDLYNGVYVEPYAGGASVALSLLLNGYASKIIINDIDLSIFAFWYSVLNDTERLCKRIKDTRVTPKVWEKQKVIQKSRNEHELIDVAFSTFFLNRTNRSGILNAGMIGGKAQEGEWKIDARYNKNELLKRIEKIALYKDKIELHNSDAVKLLKKLKRRLPAKTLIYFDPPYYVKGKDLYLNYYLHGDHEEIAKEIYTIGRQKWIVTYDAVEPIKKLYTNYRQVNYQLNYSAAQASKGQEVMIFSDNLVIATNKTADK